MDKHLSIIETDFDDEKDTPELDDFYFNLTRSDEKKRKQAEIGKGTRQVAQKNKKSK